VTGIVLLSNIIPWRRVFSLLLDMDGIDPLEAGCLGEIVRLFAKYFDIVMQKDYGGKEV